MPVAETTRITLPVEGMHCAGCAGRVERALAALPGVTAASVNLATRRATIEGEAIEAGALRAAVEAAGYASPEQATEIAVGGMTCAGCARRVERQLAALPGVNGASVNFATGRATVRHAPDAVDRAALESAIREAGYEPVAEAVPGDRAGHGARAISEESELRRDALVAAALAVPLFLVEMGGHLLPAVHDAIGGVWNWVQFALASAVVFGPGLRFHRVGWPALFRGAPEMNSLVALGTLAAWAYSAAVMLAPGLLPEGSRHVYFEASAVIVALVLLGRWMEARSRGRASAAIRRLLDLQPAVARVERGGQEVEVPASGLRTGDVMRLRPGERVPTDAVVLEGESHIDESMVTGESVPVRRTAGDVVVGGTVNGAGALRLRATAVGSGTVLARITRLVEEAQGGKLPIQALADRVTLWFVPAVIGVAALTFLGWTLLGGGVAQALVAAVAVLIIACPCAMGLATPIAVMVGSGRGAELGVLFRRGAALQALQGVSVVAMDKTGTLTEGRPALTDLVAAPGFEETALLPLIAAAESGSEHPVAAAIRAAATERGISVPMASDVQALPGMGLRASVGGQRVEIGADRYMASLGVDVSPFAAAAARLGEAGRSPVYAAVDGRLAAILAVADPLRPSTPAAMSTLRGMGLRLAMVSGDNRRTAEAIARPVGIDEVEAEVLPEEKVEAVRRLKGRGALAFVGDGINDAPALAAADVGIAIGTGTDVAIESADVVLMSGDPRGIATAIALSRATLRNIRQNLFWAFAYNVVLIPVAVAGLLSPVLAAAAMGLSSVFVVGNALRLRGFAP
ncbi:heavy metal translocating P-type ATPase [Pararoseomonas indoligenes]|uniref:P-type Cu(2+) transporter n=1 Tax=Roseomonas indoligenes TaxID=2820811 RepID=A0A940MW62_9PROT|nr:heavy metal translocating P-type ATPase [Pararoseomonas indoligenes]MBP0494524.1 copper-translocating P-type ATPase [Pararoseomonas indoligenes]